MKLLPQSFYARDVVEVARDLVGKHVRRGGVTLRITEVEAYDQRDSACHAFSGLTKRNAPLWGAPGHAYVYLCYGLHDMLNFVADTDGRAAAVLVRSCEPVKGKRTITNRRGGKTGPVTLTGPGKVGQALAVDPSWSEHVLFRRGGLSVLEGDGQVSLLVGPRVGIDYAKARDRRLPWRFADAESSWVTHRRELGPLRGRIVRARRK
jgi:DNA-3-methyladenine glycosylase